ncbi:MAG: amidohydrolase [Acidobacteria bacterium]|nr:amidohydrolase [Acidobacteriota bacterium]
MPVIDIHCHVFNSKEFPLTEAVLADTLWQSSEIMGPGWTDMLRDGKFAAIELYLEKMGDLGVDRLCLVCPSNTRSGSRAINKIHHSLVRKYPDQLIGFASVPTHPGENGADELERAVLDWGFKGAKVYPALHRVPLDAPSMVPIYERAAKLDVPILTHSTPFPQSYTGFRWKMPANAPQKSPRTDEKLDFTFDNLMRLFDSGILANFPNLKIIGAHVGGGIFYYKDYILNKNPHYAPLFKQIYVDVTPPTYYPADMVQNAMNVLGEDHVLFGSDFPLCPLEGVRACLDAVEKYPFSKTAKQKILGSNAAKLLHLNCE